MAPRANAGTKRKGSSNSSTPTRTLAVRMLTGPYAGRVVRVGYDEAKELCSGWQPSAELVSVNPVDQREKR